MEAFLESASPEPFIGTEVDLELLVLKSKQHSSDKGQLTHPILTTGNLSYTQTLHTLESSELALMLLSQLSKLGQERMADKTDSAPLAQPRKAH